MQEKELNSIELKMENGIASVFKVNGQKIEGVLSFTLTANDNDNEWVLQLNRDEYYATARPKKITE